MNIKGHGRCTACLRITELVRVQRTRQRVRSALAVGLCASCAEARKGRAA